MTSSGSARQSTVSMSARKDVCVVGRRSGQPADDRVRRCPRTILAEGTHRCESRPVGLDLVLVERADELLSARVPGLGKACRIIKVSPNGPAEQLCVHHSYADPASRRRVSAGPRIADGGEPGHDRSAVHGETAVSVQDACHRQHGL
jgi:hypothetical protein